MKSWIGFAIKSLLLIAQLGFGLSVMANTTLATDAYLELRRLVQDDLFSACPPELSHFVFIGQSPTPLLAFLENLGSTTVSSLPLTYADRIQQSIEIEADPRLQRMLYGHELAENQKLFSQYAIQVHFSRFLPSLENLSSRRLCLVDFMVTGSSLVATRRMIESYYQAAFAAKPALVAVGLDDRQQDTSELPYIDFLIPLDRYHELPVLMNLGDFEKVSSHGSYYPPILTTPDVVKTYASQSSPPLEPRSEYLVFKANLLEQMKRDPRVMWLNCQGFLRP